MTEPTRADLRVEVPIDWRGNSPRTEARPLTSAEFDVLARQWLREKIGDGDDLRDALWRFTSFRTRVRIDNEQALVDAVRAVLDVLDPEGGS